MTLHAKAIKGRVLGLKDDVIFTKDVKEALKELKERLNYNPTEVLLSKKFVDWNLKDIFGEELIK